MVTFDLFSKFAESRFNPPLLIYVYISYNGNTSFKSFII